MLTMLGLALAVQEATFSDEEKGFTAAIPPGWSVTRGKEATRHLVLTAPAGQAGSTCVIAVQPPMKAVTDGQVSLDAFLDEVKKAYPKKFAGFEFAKAEKGKDGDALILDLYYTYMSAGQKIGQLQRLVWTKTQHYSIVFGCLADAFESKKADFETYAKAFKAGPKK